MDKRAGLNKFFKIGYPANIPWRFETQIFHKDCFYAYRLGFLMVSDGVSADRLSVIGLGFKVLGENK